MRFYRPIHFVMSGCRLLNDEGGGVIPMMRRTALSSMSIS